MMIGMVEKLKKTGANVIICQKGIDDMVQYYLARNEMMTVRRVKKSDMDKLSRATGGNIVTNLDDLTSKDLGLAKIVQEKKIMEDKLLFIEGCKNPKSVTILIRAVLQKLIDEGERAMEDALSALAAVAAKNKIVSGGGAIEMEIAKRLQTYGTKVGGREQLAIEAFASTFESIPRTLAENAGLDPIDTMVTLRAAHAKKTGLDIGIDIHSGKVKSMSRLSVIDPTRVKEQAIKSATEAASMILRVDDAVTAAKPSTSPSGPKGGAPPY
jgi:chaperonin GroEL (HSP60 family)